MLRGGVLLLAGAKHLYESLNDALNQHYSPEGEGEDVRFYPSLTMNGYTNHFPISSKFRFIVIGQEATCRDLLPPFINRFVKTNLNFSSALSLAQHNLAGYLRLKAEDEYVMCFFLHVSLLWYCHQHYDGNGKVNLLGLFVPGYSDDTIDSMAYMFPTSVLECDPNSCRQKALHLFSFMCTPRGVHGHV